jgi:flagellar hook-basal body complex protein FliE
MNTISPEQALLQQMRTMAQSSSINASQPVNPAVDGVSAGHFTQVLNQALQSVNESETTSEALKTSYEKGTPGLNLIDVMLASEKAELSFQAMVQVRNKVVSAYQEIMNMQI